LRKEGTASRGGTLTVVDKRLPRAVVALVVTLACFGLAACGTSSGGSHLATPAADVVSLVAGGSPGTVEESEIAAAEYLLTSNCMRRKGFFLPAPSPPAPSAEQEGPRLFYDGGALASVPPEASSLRAARELGFGIARRRDRTQGGHVSGESVQVFRTGSQVRKARPRDVAYHLAMEGPDNTVGTFTVAGIAQHTYPKSGCGASGLSGLYGSPLLAVEASYLPEDLGLVVNRDVLSDPRFVETANRWAACFAVATSRHVSSPYAVVTTLLEGEQGGAGPVAPQMREYEVRLAVADARCQYSTGFVRTVVALRRSYAAQSSTPYEGLLLDIVEARARASHKAQAVLSAAGR
jgi:hypothetical protein